LKAIHGHVDDRPDARESASLCRWGKGGKSKLLAARLEVLSVAMLTQCCRDQSKWLSLHGSSAWSAITTDQIGSRVPTLVDLSPRKLINNKET
jgi:hypothetical protein